jgi:transcriptional regulator with XRE-family HTH domain
LSTQGERLKYYGIKTYGELQKFADALKISKQSLSNYITGRANIGRKLIDKLREINAPVDYILYEKTLDEIGAEPVKMTDLEKESLIALIEKLKSEKANHLLLIQQLLSDREMYEDAIKLLGAEGNAIGSIADFVAKLRQRIIK